MSYVERNNDVKTYILFYSKNLKERRVSGRIVLKCTWQNKVVIIVIKDVADQIKENEVGGAYGTHGRGDKSVQSFGGKARREKTTWKTKA
jgi:hypothetical protein